MQDTLPDLESPTDPVLEAPTIGSWERDLQTGVGRWSANLFLFFRRDAVLGVPSFKDFFQYVHPDDCDKVRAAHERMLRGGDTEPYELYYRTNPVLGSVRYAHVIPHVLRDGSGRAERMIGVVRDVTQQHQLEQFRDEENEVLELIARGAPLRQVLDRLVRAIEAQFPEMVGTILLLDEDGKRLRHGSAPSLPDDYSRAVDGVEIGPRVGSCGTAAFRKERVVVQDITTDPLWVGYAEGALKHGLRACWSSPIFDSQHRVLGTFAIYYKSPGSPRPQHMRFVELATHTAAICLERHRTLQELQRREQRFSAVVLNTPNVAVQLYDHGGRVLFWNPASEAMFGWSAPEAVGCTLDRLIHTADEFKAFVCTLDEIGRTGNAVGPLEYEFRRRDGSTGVCLSTIFAVPDQGGGKNFVCMDVDMTHRKEAELELETREKKYRALFDLSPAGILLSDAQGNIIEANVAISGITGYPREELIGMDVRRLVPEPMRDEVGRNIQTILSGAAMSHEVENITKDGRSILAELRETPMTLPSGAPGVLTVVQNITERKQAEAAIQERLKLEERLSKLATTTPGVIYSFRLRNDGRVCMPYSSPAIFELSGYHPHELVEDCKQVFQHISPIDIERIWDSILDSARTLNPWRQEFRITPPGGKSELWLEGRSTPSREPDGSVLWHGFLHDITPRKQAESDRQKLVAKLLHSEDVERRRIARELHDTTAQHLAATKLNLTRLLKNGNSTSREQTQIINDSLGLIEQAVQEVRTLTYLLHPPLLEELGLVGALHDYASGFERRSGVQVTLDTDGYKGRISQEIEMVLFRVIQESLANVLRHSGSSIVLIRLERDDTEVRLEVQDSGHGLPPGSVKPDTKFLRRMGVGIAAMRERVQHVGGKLAIESDAEGVTVLATVPVSSDVDGIVTRTTGEEIIS